ncbi:MAG: hypothetical protein HUJ90_01425 [Bacteroidales bacterium]|nr:hypothetical protein [Bacteroidales bacterium]
MKRMFKKVLGLAVVAMALVSCNNAAKMAEMADQIKINCNPAVLEVIAGNIDADVSVTFPAEYFYPKAKLTVTPVLKYKGGEVVGTPFIYQGSKVTENYKTVSEDGATIAEHVHFKYVEGMEKSELVARAEVIYKGKTYAYPEDIKIADGANTTYMLVCQKGSYHMMSDNYQEVIPEEVEAQILYLINSADVRSNQINSADVKDYKNSVSNIMNDERRTIKGTEIVAYASPDGPEAKNNTLSDKRGASAEKAFKTVSKNLETGEVETRSIGEDWEGFRELVSNSNIEDKDLIIRVLSMYSDPAVREREIKNMSSVYKSLANGILPQLRRARFITSVEYKNYTPEELTDLVQNNIDVLDEEALLRAATLVEKADAKLAIYKQAINKYNSDRAKYNSAIVYLDEGKNADAKAMLDKVADNKKSCVKNAYGVIAMREKNYDEAARIFAEVTCNHGKVNSAVLDILNGKYSAAVEKLAGTGSDNEALAYLLVNQLDKAEAAITCDCAKSYYLKAIIAARKGDAATANAMVQQAAAKKASFEERAANDVEFVKIRK